MTQQELEVLFGEERAAWYRLAPMERMARSALLWDRYLAAGGSLAPEYDSSDPMHEIYLEEGIYEPHTIPSDLVRENCDFESLIAATRACDSPAMAQTLIEKFRQQLKADETHVPTRER